MSPAVTRNGARGRPRGGAPGPPKRKAPAQEPEKKDNTSSSEEDDGIPSNTPKLALRIRLDGPYTSAARSAPTAQRKAPKQSKTTTVPAQKKRARKRQKTTKEPDAPQPNGGADYPTPDSNQPAQQAAVPDPTPLASNGELGVEGEEETGADEVQPDMLAILNDACAPRSSPNRQLHEEDEGALGSERASQHVPDSAVDPDDRMQLDHGGDEVELPDTDLSAEPTNGTADQPPMDATPTPANATSRPKRTVASRHSLNQKPAKSRPSAKASVNGQTGSHRRHTMGGAVEAGSAAPMWDLPASPDNPPVQGSVPSPWLDKVKDAYHQRLARHKDLATKGAGLAQGTANSRKGGAANASVKPKTPAKEGEEEEEEEEEGGDYEPLSDATDESLPPLSRVASHRSNRKSLRKSQGQLPDEHAGPEPINDQEPNEQQEANLEEERPDIGPGNDEQLHDRPRIHLEFGSEFDSDDDEEPPEDEEETPEEAPDNSTDAYEEWAQKLIAIQLHDDEVEKDNDDVGTLFLHDVRQFRARPRQNRDDSAFLEAPATSNPTITIQLPQQDVGKAHGLMRLKGWSQLSSNWDIRLLATNEAASGLGKYMAHHLTKLGRFCSVAPSALEIDEQSQFFHDHRDLVSHYFDQISTGIEKIRNGWLSPVEVLLVGNQEVWERKREDMLQDLVRLIIPLLVQVLKQAYSLGEDEDKSSFSVYTIQLLGRIVAWTRHLYEPLMRQINTDPLEDKPQAKTTKAQWERDNRAREQLGPILRRLHLLLSEAPKMLQEEEKHQAVLKSARKIQLQRQVEIQLRQQLATATRDQAQREQNRRVAQAIRGETPAISSRSRATSVVQDGSRYAGSSRAQTVELEADQDADAYGDDWMHEEEVALCKKLQKAYDYNPPRLPDLATTAATVGHSRGQTKEKARDLLSSMLTQAFPQRSGRDIQSEVHGLMRRWR
jgi:hypothetical protein